MQPVNHCSAKKKNWMHNLTHKMRQTIKFICLETPRTECHKYITPAVNILSAFFTLTLLKHTPMPCILDFTDICLLCLIVTPFCIFARHRNYAHHAR